MKYVPLFLAALALTTSCKQQQGDHTTGTEETAVETVASAEPVVLKSGDLTLTEIVSPVFTDARISVNSPAPGTAVAGNPVTFDFGVEQYELGAQTGDAATKLCANSAEGQHIHLIIDNAPYTAHYAASFDQEVAEGPHVGLAFLSRSYHESIKTPNAYKLFPFAVGEGAAQPEFDFEAPHMFYSRPKGTYKGSDTKLVMLDFYLVNADLSADGYRVRANINGEEFLIDKWVPYGMEGLPMGENTIELTLIDAAGKTVQSPFNPVTRTVMLEE